MQESNRCSVQAINPLIKLVRQREDLFFQLLYFVNKNMESSSNDLDHLTIFNKFILHITTKHSHSQKKQHQFLSWFIDSVQQSHTTLQDPVSKQMLRLSTRLIQILQASTAKVRKSVFDEKGKTDKDFARFKLMLNKILKRELFQIKDYVEYIIGYCTNKFVKQLTKIQQYVERVEQGQDVWFRELYNKQGSDVQVSPEDKKPKESKLEIKTIKKIVQIQHLSSTEEVDRDRERDKKTSPKKTMKPIKRKERMLNIKKKEQQPPNKEQTANKLLKFYALLQLNKKQFIEDYVYDQINQEKHRTELLNQLLDRNKEINKQINNYVKRSLAYIPSPLVICNKSSGDQRNQSTASKLSLRTSFVISKRKASFHFQSSSANQKHSDLQRNDHFQKTIKNINPRRRSSHSNQRPQQKSKKLFVVKAPMVFEDEVIPQVQVNQTQWLQHPLSNKCRGERKNDNIRLKRKGNPNPLQNAFLPQNFRYLL